MVDKELVISYLGKMSAPKLAKEIGTTRAVVYRIWNLHLGKCHCGGRVETGTSSCGTCKEVARNLSKEYRKKNTQGIAQRRRGHQLRFNYGISENEYNEMVNRQDGVCAICKKTNDDQVLCVDHDHRTGEVRGLLCRQCNVALGAAKDSVQILENMIQYLKCHTVDIA